jgi:hypothetical protein
MAVCLSVPFASPQAAIMQLYNPIMLLLFLISTPLLVFLCLRRPLESSLFCDLAPVRASHTADGSALLVHFLSLGLTLVFRSP